MTDHGRPDIGSGLMSRREALSRLGALAALGNAMPGLSCQGVRAAGLRPVGIQLYTVRKEMEKSVEATLARVAGIGYQEVEFAGHFRRTPAQLAATAPVPDDDVWPPYARGRTVRQCLGTVLNEQWEHHRFTSRDLNLIAGRTTSAV